MSNCKNGKLTNNTLFHSLHVTCESRSEEVSSIGVVAAVTAPAAAVGSSAPGSELYR